MNYGGSLYFSEVVVEEEKKKNVKLGFWQCLHVRGKLIKQPIKRMLAGSSDEKKKNAVEEHCKLKRRRKSS